MELDKAFWPDVLHLAQMFGTSMRISNTEHVMDRLRLIPVLHFFSFLQSIAVESREKHSDLALKDSNRNDFDVTSVDFETQVLSFGLSVGAIYDLLGLVVKENILEEDLLLDTLVSNRQFPIENILFNWCFRLTRNCVKIDSNNNNDESSGNQIPFDASAITSTRMDGINALCDILVPVCVFVFVFDLLIRLICFHSCCFFFCVVWVGCRIIRLEVEIRAAVVTALAAMTEMEEYPA